ncbi:hypothetical protein S101446_03299 (plasmid) [Komagataeibacter europaeus]|nr:hypothetical protein S101446_03299 [Komagataeibacter europaeus]
MMLLPPYNPDFNRIEMAFANFFTAAGYEAE